MRKVLAVTAIMLITCGVSSGAVSEDMSVYVRKDVFEVYMQNMNRNMERILDELKEQRKAINDLSDRVSNLSDRVSNLSGRVEGLDRRMGDLQNYIYLILVLLGIIVILPSVQKFMEWREMRKPLITLDDVKRLIEENNAELRKTLRT